MRGRWEAILAPLESITARSLKQILAKAWGPGGIGGSRWHTEWKVRVLVMAASSLWAPVAFYFA